MLKLSTIEELRDKGIITLITCDKSEKEIDFNVVRDSSTNTYYKIEQSSEEIKIELLNACFKALSTIKNIMLGFTILFIISLVLALFR